MFSSSSQQETQFDRLFSTDEDIFDPVRLDVEDKQLFVSKSFLSMASPVFKKMFQSELKEKDAEAVPLEGKKYNDVLEFLLCLHPEVHKPVTPDNVYTVLPLAGEYQNTHIKQECEKTLIQLIDRYNSTYYNDKVTKAMIQAELFSLKNVIQRGIEYFTGISSVHYRDHGEFSKLSPSTRCTIYYNRLCKYDKS